MQLKNLLLIKLEWESILDVFYRDKITNNTFFQKMGLLSVERSRKGA